MGDRVIGGDILGTVPETAVVLHKIMVPPNVSGTIEKIESGSFTVLQPVAVIRTDDGKTVEVPMAVTYLWTLAGKPAPEKGASFTDVAADAAYAKAVA